MELSVNKIGINKASKSTRVMALSLLAAAVAAGIASPLGQKHSEISAPSAAGVGAAQQAALGQLPLSFEPNVGQAGESVEYVARSSGGALLFAPSAVGLLLGSGNVENAAAGVDASTEAQLVSMQFTGSAGARISAGAEMAGKINYLVGKDVSKWQTDVATYGKITYEGLYSGVDLEYTGNDGVLKGTYEVGAGVDPGVVRWKYSNAQKVSVDADGNLLIVVPGGADVEATTLTEHAPVAWQEVSGQRVSVSASYEVEADGSIGFALGEYDAALPLTIDPTITYSTYLGGNNSDYGGGIGVDGAGNIIVAGSTLSTNFPTMNPLQATCNSCSSGLADAVVSKFNPAGSALIYSTYLGGSGNDGTVDMQVDPAGNAYVAGQTDSIDFPTVNAYRATPVGLYDVFLFKLNPAGNALVYSTYLGGTGPDFAYSLEILSGASGYDAYVSGTTISTDFPLLNAYQGTFGGGGSDLFVTRFYSSGSQLVYSTYLGGNQSEESEGLEVDALGNAYIAGYTISPNYPTLNAFQSTYGGNGDGFLTKIAPTGNALVYSTYLGGPNQDVASDVAVDALGQAVVTGDVETGGFPLQGAIQSTFGGGDEDAFVTKFNAAGNGLVYSTYLGGGTGPGLYGGRDRGSVVAVNSAGEAFVSGYTYSSNFPTVNAFQGTYGGTCNAVAGGDVFLTRINAGGTALSYSSFLGGSCDESPFGIVAMDNGDIYLTGMTTSTNFPRVNAYQQNKSSLSDLFVTKIQDATGPTPTATATSAVPTATSTGTSTVTSTPTATSTSIAPSSTPTRTATNTAVVPTGTSTATATATSTGVVPTATSTASATSTGVAPTATASATACAIEYSDVPSGSTFYEFVKCLACHGIINGYPDNTFRPNNPVTRGQLAKIISNAAGYNEPVSGQTFEDVAVGSTFYEFVERLASREIIGGYACGGEGEPCGQGNRPYFRPNGNATRGQLAKIVCRAYGCSGTVSGQTFEDVLPSSTFYQDIEHLYALGSINGYACGGVGEPCGQDNRPYFRPSNSVTRGQTSKIVSSTFFPGCAVR